MYQTGNNADMARYKHCFFWKNKNTSFTNNWNRYKYV